MTEPRELTDQEREILAEGARAKEATLKEAQEARKENQESERNRLEEEIKNYDEKLEEKLHAFEAAHHFTKVQSRPEDVVAQEEPTFVEPEGDGREALTEPAPTSSVQNDAVADRANEGDESDEGDDEG